MVMGLLYLLTVTLLSLQLAHAADFSMNSNEFAAVLLKHTISNLEISNKLIDVFNSVSQQTSDSLYQNLWGIAYGGVVLSGINNEVTAKVLDNIVNDPQKIATIGTAFDDLGSNATTIFGDADGTTGISMFLKKQVSILNNNDAVLKDYADALARSIYSYVEFFVKLGRAIPDAF